MADKLTAAVTVKLSPQDMARGSALAQMRGMCVSEFMRHLLGEALSAKEAEYRALASIFRESSEEGHVNNE